MPNEPTEAYSPHTRVTHHTSARTDSMFEDGSLRVAPDEPRTTRTLLFASWTEMLRAMSWLVVRGTSFSYEGELDPESAPHSYRYKVRFACTDEFFAAYDVFLRGHCIAARTL